MSSQETTRNEVQPTTDFAVDFFELPNQGRVGISGCPGLRHRGRRVVNRHLLNQDLITLKNQGTDILITLLDVTEIHNLRLEYLGTEARAIFGRHGWFHVPLLPGTLPDVCFDSYWNGISRIFQRTLDAGGCVVMHCHESRDRASLLCGRLILESGSDLSDVLDWLGCACPGISRDSRRLYALNNYWKQFG